MGFSTLFFTCYVSFGFMCLLLPPPPSLLRACHCTRASVKIQCVYNADRSNGCTSIHNYKMNGWRILHTMKQEAQRSSLHNKVLVSFGPVPCWRR